MTVPGKSETVVTIDPAEAPAAVPPTPAATTVEGADGGERLYGGKYKSVEELEAAYTQLNKPADDKGGNGPATIGDATTEEASDALSRAGLSMDDFATEFNTSGALSAESYTKLQDAGFPKELVDVYVDGLKARVQTYETSVYAPVGGKDGYTALVQWAATNLGAEQKRAFNDAVQSGDPGRAALAVQGLVALRGGSNKLLSGKTTSADNTGIKPFQSQAQVVAAMRDPRYRNDTAYQKEVSERLKASGLFK